MTVDVVWDGVPLAQGATAREQDGGWFVELEQPMPVGTTVQLSGDVQATVAVARVHEGAGAGMLLKSAASRAAAAPATSEAASAADAAPAAEDEPKENGAAGGAEKKERRRKKR